MRSSENLRGIKLLQKEVFDIHILNEMYGINEFWNLQCFELF